MLERHCVRRRSGCATLLLLSFECFCTCIYIFFVFLVVLFHHAMCHSINAQLPKQNISVSVNKWDLANCSQVQFANNKQPRLHKKNMDFYSFFLLLLLFLFFPRLWPIFPPNWNYKVSSHHQSGGVIGVGMERAAPQLERGHKSLGGVYELIKHGPEQYSTKDPRIPCCRPAWCVPP